MIVYHPNPQMLGRPANESSGFEAFREVLATGRQTITYTVSEYLGVDEERIYYPLQLGGRRWVAGIGIPRLAIEQDIDDFHFYTILTAVISVLFFATLLIVAQRRWRREYDLRRLSEQESAQLHLQQVLEQIDPHFLFNSLNSLYALIRCNPEQAREFTLTLSKVYRHVLERRKQILSTLSDEIDFTWQYYSLQKIRFGDRIELTTAIDPALRNWRIPAMSLQTLVENALKHNRITGLNPLRIRIRTEGESLVIENNYTPRSEGMPSRWAWGWNASARYTGSTPRRTSPSPPTPRLSAAGCRCCRRKSKIDPKLLFSGRHRPPNCGIHSPNRAFVPIRFSLKNLNYIITSCGLCIRKKPSNNKT